MTYQTIIVDDEPLARKRLQKLLSATEDIELCQVCSNGKEALKAIEEHTPDLLFLDIQMPEMNGFEVVEQLNQDNLPTIVFVTAYDEYALKAFEVHAVDYLLKPFDEERFSATVERAKEVTQKRKNTELADQLNALLNDMQQQREYIKRVMIKQSDRVFFLDVNDIDYIESSGNYVKIHSGEKSYMIRDTLSNMCNNLNPDQFYRIHRSTIVNIDVVKELQPWFHGDYMVKLNDGTKLTMSRNYKSILNK